MLSKLLCFIGEHRWQIVEKRLIDDVCRCDRCNLVALVSPGQREYVPLDDLSNDSRESIV